MLSTVIKQTTVCNQDKPDLLKRAGDVAALLFSPSDDGFMVNTTCKLYITCIQNRIVLIYTGRNVTLIFKIVKNYLIMHNKMALYVGTEIKHYIKLFDNVEKIIISKN